MKKYTDDEAIKWANEELKNPNAPTDKGCTLSTDFNFNECCRRHDVMTNVNQGISDKQANRMLKECVTSKRWPKIAWIYWVAVSAASKTGGYMNFIVIIVSITVMYIVLFLS